MNPARLRSQFWTILFPLCLFIACSSCAQSPSPPSGNNSTNLLAVEITIFDNKTFHAPATISIIASVSQSAPGRKGDSVRVEFFANTNRLGVRKSFWHDAVRPNPHSRNAQPMIMVAAGFDLVELVWSDPPAGNYTLTARATGAKGRSATSSPVSITILPPPSPPP